MFSFAKRQREQGWMAVCLRGDCVEFAHVVRADGGVPVLRQWGREILPADGDGLGNSAKARELKRFRCTTLLASGEYQFIQTEAPAVLDAEMKEALRWKLKDLVDLPQETTGFDVLPIPDTSLGGRPRQIFIALAANSVVAPVVQRFQGAGINLEAIDLPELAQRNIAALFEDENRGLAFLVFYETFSLLTFTYRGELFAFRRIDIGSEQFLQAAAERREQLCERVVLEMQRSMDTVDRQFSAISLSRLVMALPMESGLEEHFRSALYLPFEVMQLDQKMDMSAFPELAEPEAQRLALRTIGAALRDDEVAA